MPRQVRIEFEGSMYHVMARRDRREAIMRDDEDRRTFLRLNVIFLSFCERCLREIPPQATEASFQSSYYHAGMTLISKPSSVSWSS